MESKKISQKNIEDLDDFTKRRLGEYGCELLRLAREAVRSSKKYQNKSHKNSAFDFRGNRFILWDTTNNENPELIIKQRYGYRTSGICIGGIFKAIEKGWVGKPVKREVFVVEVSKMYPSMNPSDVTKCLRGKLGEVFNYDHQKETVTITYLPREVML